MNQIQLIKKFNINFNQIERLTINNTDNELDEASNEEEEEDEYLSEDCQNFYKILFSFQIGNNLTYLNICLDIGYCNMNLNPKYFENLNECKSLEYLYLSYFTFECNFLFKLKNLKKLYMRFCNNIIFDNDIFNSMPKYMR